MLLWASHIIVLNFCFLLERRCNIIDFDGFSKKTFFSSLCQISTLFAKEMNFSLIFSSVKVLKKCLLHCSLSHLLSSPKVGMFLYLKNSPSLGYASSFCRVIMFKVASHSCCLFLLDKGCSGDVGDSPSLPTAKTQA